MEASNLRVHVKCRKSYINDAMIKAFKRKKILLMNATAASPQAPLPEFDYLSNCLICGCDVVSANSKCRQIKMPQTKESLKTIALSRNDLSGEMEKTEDHNKSVHSKLKMAVESALDLKILQIRLTCLPNSFFKQEKNEDKTSTIRTELDLGLHSELDIKPDPEEMLKDEPQDCSDDNVNDDINALHLTVPQQGDNNDYVSIKQESDMEFDSVEGNVIDAQNDGNMQDDNDVSLKQEDDIECNDIDGEEVNTQVAFVNSQANVNSTTNLKLTTQEAEHIAADMDLARKKQKTDTKCHPDEINNTNANTECLDAVKKTDNIFDNCSLNKTNEYSCDLCKYVTNRRNNFNYHVKVHSATTHYICDKCYYITSLENSLRRHFRLHAGARSYACEICDKKFIQCSDLTKHVRTHTGEKPYSCEICDKKFNQSSTLTKHVRTHTGEKPYACEICDKKFAQNFHLTDHIRTHTDEKPYACKICDKKFNQSSTLTNHVRTHTGEKPYACEICDKKFIQSSDLTKHIRTHTSEKPYACEICDKKFAQNVRLTDHIRTHTGKKPYACKICDKKFTTNSQLTRHVRTHTNQK